MAIESFYQIYQTCLIQTYVNNIMKVNKPKYVQFNFDTLWDNRMTKPTSKLAENFKL